MTKEEIDSRNEGIKRFHVLLVRVYHTHTAQHIKDILDGEGRGSQKRSLFVYTYLLITIHVFFDDGGIIIAHIRDAQPSIGRGGLLFIRLTRAHAGSRSRLFRFVPCHQ